MLRILNITAIAFYALWGLFTLAIRFFADHPAGYSIELFTVDMMVLYQVVLLHLQVLSLHQCLQINL